MPGRMSGGGRVPVLCAQYLFDRGHELADVGDQRRYELRRPLQSVGGRAVWQMRVPLRQRRRRSSGREFRVCERGDGRFYDERVHERYQPHDQADGDKGEIRGAMEKNEIEIIHFGSGKVERISFEDMGGHVGHGGGDLRLVKDFLKLVRTNGASQGLTSADASVQSHLMAFAAEQSRVEGTIIGLQEFKERYRAKEEAN